ncbi:MAG: DUF1887 family protein [Pseudomonadales bacterium]|nr:DUF1887 family protein [Pseudomonadales bacterium]
MTTWFVSEYERSHFWLKTMLKKGRLPDLEVDHWVTGIDVKKIQEGDLVLGTLPLSIILQLNERKARFKALVLKRMPRPGQEFTATELAHAGARFIEVQMLDPQATVTTDIVVPPSEENISESWLSQEQVHIGFVSDQLAPLYLASREFAEHIRHLELLVTSRFKKQAEILRTTLTPYISNITLTEFNDNSSYPQLLEQLEQVCNRLIIEYPHARLVGNLTGGTKLMSMALSAQLHVFHRYTPIQTLYTHTEVSGNRYELMTPSDIMPMKTNMSIREYLLLQGIQIDDSPGKGIRSEDESWRQNAEGRARLTEDLYRLDSNSLIMLNTLASHARIQYTLGRPRGSEEGLRANQKTSVDVAQFVNNNWHKSQWANIHRLLIQHDWRITKRSDTGTHILHFKNHEEAHYLGGTWLEEWLWFRLKDLGFEQAGALGVGVNVLTDTHEVDNEFDVIMIWKNRLLAIECKTSLQNNDKASSQLYKLDSKKRRISQLHGLGVYISKHAVSQEFLMRCQDLRIHVLAGEPLKSQGNKIKEFKCQRPDRIKQMVISWKEMGRFLTNEGVSAIYEDKI